MLDGDGAPLEAAEAARGIPGRDACFQRIKWIQMNVF